MTGSSRASTADRQGSSPFEPPFAVLSSLSANIQDSVSKYEKADTHTEKAAALKEIQRTATKLSRATAPIPQRFMQLNHRPYVNVAVRIAVEMGLFEALPSSGESITLEELAKKTNAEEEFLLRISRVLGAFEILAQSESSSVLEYSHTPMSRFLTTPPAKASFKFHYEIMLPAHVDSVPGYYLDYGFKNPEDAKNCPFTFAHCTKDADFFDILGTIPEKMELFKDAMTIMAVLGLEEVVLLYGFDKLEPNADGIALVDVGGGKGHILNTIREVYPNMKGKSVLEDLKPVLEGGTAVPEDEIDLKPYDFFKEVQPIKGANYFLKAILHDWPDRDCLQILRNLAPAMRGHPHSRLLISELVIPDHNPDAAKVLRDMTMLVVSGKERSLTQWHGLLGRAGFKILQVYGMDHANASIIEAVLDE